MTTIEAGPSRTQHDFPTTSSTLHAQHVSRPETAAAQVIAATGYLAGTDYWSVQVHGSEFAGYVVTVHTTYPVAAQLATRFDTRPPAIRDWADGRTTATWNGAIGPIHLTIRATMP